MLSCVFEKLSQKIYGKDMKEKMEYVYCAEKLINGTIVDLYRKKASVCEKYIIDSDTWSESKDAYKAFEGGSFIVKMTPEDAYETLDKWQSGVRLCNMIDLKSDRKVYYIQYEEDITEQ